jgi:hypothetical protein
MSANRIIDYPPTFKFATAPSCAPTTTAPAHPKKDDDQAIGRSKGGLSTKIHALVDAPLAFLPSAQPLLSDNDFSGSPQPTPTSSQRNTSGPVGWPGCYDAVAIVRAAGSRMLVMSRIRHAAIVP